MGGCDLRSGAEEKDHAMESLSVCLLAKGEVVEEVVENAYTRAWGKRILAP